MDSVECIVVGAGVVGLAVARHLASAGREVLILERHAAVGTETSSRNSEVIHSGLYYPGGSLKARSCVRGRELLYEYCGRRAVPYRRCGKLIVATNESQIAELRRISSAAVRNGVRDLEWLTRSSARELEPQLECVAALHAVSTGIVDSHSLMLALQADAERSGAILVLQTTVSRVSVTPTGLQVTIAEPADMQLKARWLVNAAGLGAIDLARRIDGLAAETVPRLHLAKGSYFSLTGHSPFSRLVYPVPELGGLGVHLTLDLAGRARFGPDVQWVDAIDYGVDPDRCVNFYANIRRYWPGLREGSLLPAYSGIRPKIAGPQESAADFRIDGPGSHGVPGLVNLFGIESPGLTASLAIAEHVSRMVGSA